jgi:hypothetical protein
MRRQLHQLSTRHDMPRVLGLAAAVQGPEEVHNDDQ